jgi:hypothetical protein
MIHSCLLADSDKRKENRSGQIPGRVPNHVGLLINGPTGSTGLPFIQSSDDFDFIRSSSRLSV